MRETTTRRLASLAVGAMVLPLALTACSSSSSGGSGGSGGGAAAQCGSGAGVGKPSGGTIKVGFQGPLSGDNQQLGINAVDGMKVAVDQANKTSGLPYKLELVTSDDMGSPDQGPTAAQQLVDKGVVAVVGPMFSGATKASEPVFCQNGVLSVSPSATNPSLTSLGFSNFVRVIAPDTVQGKAVADYIVKTQKAKKVFSLDDKSEYGTGLSSALEPQLRADGAQVVHDGINPTKDYTSEATKVVGENPDVLYYSGYYAEFALLAKALKAKGFKGKLMSGDGSNDDQYISQAGADVANGSYLSCACGDANSDPKAKGFVSQYAALNANAKPGTYSGEAYDATNALVEVLKGLGANADRATTLDAYKKVNFNGLTKQVVFQPNGEVQGDAVYIYQVTNGQRKVLGLTKDLNK
ncbi:MAG TPA: branched-chain amino acid ABC transporter substrate-binding protein [Frankiaceae bacterium]|nr:branched-chain amino acid ABC transporter substrate-binding protein [Frankiaceae bacterium]